MRVKATDFAAAMGITTFTISGNKVQKVEPKKEVIEEMKEAGYL